MRTQRQEAAPRALSLNRRRAGPPLPIRPGLRLLRRPRRSRIRTENSVFGRDEKLATKICCVSRTAGGVRIGILMPSGRPRGDPRTAHSIRRAADPAAAAELVGAASTWRDVELEPSCAGAVSFSRTSG